MITYKPLIEISIRGLCFYRINVMHEIVIELGCLRRSELRDYEPTISLMVCSSLKRFLSLSIVLGINFQIFFWVFSYGHVSLVLVVVAVVA